MSLNLQELLGLKPRPTKSHEAVPTATLPDNRPTSNYAIVADEWDKAQGNRLHEALYDPRLAVTERQAEREALTDFHGVAFKQEPELAENCSAKRRHEFVKTLLESPDYKALHQSTCLNVMASDLAAAEFAKQYVTLERLDEENAAKSGTPAQKQQQSEMAALRAVGKAVAEAQKQVDNYEDACRGLGGDGGFDGKMPVERVAGLFNRIRNNHQLQRIFQLAGRYRRVAQSKQRQKTKHGYDDIVGVELGGEVAKLVPQELALLTLPGLELDSMRRLVEKQSIQREHRGVEKLGKGPIVVVVDESGSMSGEPVAQAKAFALAMAWVAKHQKRWIAFVSYSGGTTGECVWFPPGKIDYDKLLLWLEHFYGGGTVLDVPLRELPEVYWPAMNPPKGKTDVIIISDGICHAPEAMVQNFLAWKKREQVRCISIILNGQAGDLGKVSDETHLVSHFGLDASGIEQSLSI